MSRSITITIALSVVVAFMAGDWFATSRGSALRQSAPRYALIDGRIVKIDANGVGTAVGPRVGTDSDNDADDNGPQDDANAADAERPAAPPSSAASVRPALPAPSAQPAPAFVPPKADNSAVAARGDAPAAPVTATAAAPATNPGISGSGTPAARYRTYQNRDIEGGDIAAPMKQVDLPVCISACQTNRQCRAFSYDKWNRYCFLKSQIGALSLDPRSVTGVAENAPPPAMATGPITMERYRGKGFPGAGYRTLGGTFETCEAACRTDQACVAFTFDKSQSA